MEKGLKELLDKAEIMDLQYKYAFGVDTKNWKLFRSVFTDKIDLDMTSASPYYDHKGLPADEFVNMVKNSAHCFKTTEHQMTNSRIRFEDEDHATGITYVRAFHYKPTDIGGNVVEMGGYYDNKYVRTADGWKIYSLIGQFTWTEGNQYLFNIVAEEYSRLNPS